MKNQNTVLSGVKTILKKGIEEVVSFIYPSNCLHCGEKILSNRCLCSLCLNQLEFLERLEERKNTTFSSLGPAASLAYSIKGQASSAIAKSMAAFMVIQFEKLGWDLPDYICPSPEEKSDLAKEFASFLDIPMLEPLRLKGFFLDEYCWKKTPYLSDKRLLIVGIKLPSVEKFSLLEEAGIKESFFLSFI